MTTPAPSRPAPSTGAPRGLRADIQGLRAVAVLAVIGNHAGLPLMGGGYVGVDVFFVISGFLITGLLVREGERDGRVSITGFYARRARRILPAATLVLVAILAFSAVELSYAEVQRAATDVLWAACFLANVHFARIGTDYFSEGLPPSPVQHYWSLSVEEQYYLVWPLLLALLLLAHRRRTANTRAARDPWPMITAVAGTLVLASFVWSVVQTRVAPTDAYFSSLARAWELGVGMLLALGARHLRSLSLRLRRALAAGGATAVVLSVLFFDQQTPFPGYHALLPVLGTAALLAAGIPGGAVGVGRVLTVRPMTWIGDLSYSLYLWHWPVLVLWAARSGSERGPLETAALLVLTLGLSAFSYYLVENPVRRGHFLRSRLRGLVLWPVALAIVVGAVLGARADAGNRLQDRLDEAAKFEVLREKQVPVRVELDRSLAPSAADDPVAFPLTDLDELDGLRHDLWNYRYCYINQNKYSTKGCPVGDVDADRTMVVVGDSHVGQWLPAFDAIGAERGYRVLPLIKFGCSAYDVDLLSGPGTPYEACTQYHQWLVDEIARLHPDVVYAGGRGLQRNMPEPVEERPEAYSEGVRSLIERVSPLTDLRIISDVSPLTFDPFDCLTDAESTMGSCNSPVDERVLQANDLTRGVAEEMGVPYIDLTSLVCRHGRCPAFAGGRMVYANVDHLSMDWVEHVEDEVARRIDLPS